MVGRAKCPFRSTAFPECGALPGWNFYSEEDVPDGWLSFSGVSDLVFEPPGLLPNDYVVDFVATLVESRGDGACHVRLRIGSVNDDGSGGLVEVSFLAIEAFIRDPSRPGERIST